MDPFCLPKSTKNAPKSDPKRHQNFDRFLHRFFVVLGSVLASNLGPTWGPRRLQNRKKRPKLYSVAHPERFEMRPCFSTPSWAVLAPFWPPTWRHFGPSWLRFGPSWLRLGSVLASKLRFLSQTAVLQEMGGGPPRTGASIR